MRSDQAMHAPAHHHRQLDLFSVVFPSDGLIILAHASSLPTFERVTKRMNPTKHTQTWTLTLIIHLSQELGMDLRFWLHCIYTNAITTKSYSGGGKAHFTTRDFSVHCDRWYRSLPNFP